MGQPYYSTMSDIVKEVERARKKFPDPYALLAALTEEVGELAKALLDEPMDRVESEAIQVAAMAIRIIEEGDPALDPIRRLRGSDGASAPQAEEPADAD